MGTERAAVVRAIKARKCPAAATRRHAADTTTTTTTQRQGEKGQRLHCGACVVSVLCRAAGHVDMIGGGAQVGTAAKATRRPTRPTRAAACRPDDVQSPGPTATLACRLAFSANRTRTRHWRERGEAVVSWSDSRQRRVIRVRGPVRAWRRKQPSHAAHLVAHLSPTTALLRGSVDSTTVTHPH